jgi:flagellar biosynthetic protein FlhB
MAGEERTEAATPRKLQHLRDEGKVTKSPEVVSAIGILGGVFVLNAFGGSIWGQLQTQLADSLNHLSRPDLTDAAVGEIWMRVGIVFFTVMAPLMIAMPLIGILTNVGQSGLMLSGKALAPDLSRLNPMSGFTRMFSLRTAVDLVKTIIKVSIVAWLLYRTYLDSFPIFLSLTGSDLAGSLSLFISTAYTTALTVGGAFLVVAALDYGYQRWEFLRGAKMTKQEIKEEYKQSEGSPEVRAAIVDGSAAW